MSEEEENDVSPDDVFKILIATDIHLGYGEKDPIREMDSFTTFEEILKHAADKSVDLVLLGGDLFHDSKPSSYAIFRCMEILRKYCLGDKSVSFEYLSDESKDFKNLSNPTVNYLDPNVNIQIPIFSIHGNHDDPVGGKHISVVDIFSSSGLINYFGNSTDLKEVNISPICLKKGETKLAVFGLSHIRDERLGRLLRDKKVHFVKPKNFEEWFNLFVLHQNRVARGPKNFIPSSFLPKFLDLVIWGHEHDCRIVPESESDGVFISQPGSSVATSLSHGESLDKHIGLLNVYKNKFKLTPIKLETVRPFIFDELVLDNAEETRMVARPQKTTQEIAIEKVKNYIEKMIDRAKQKHTDPNKPPPLPLIRLNVYYYEDEQCFNIIRFGQEFSGLVANPTDILQLKPIRSKTKREKNEFETDETEEYLSMDDFALKIEDLVEGYLQKQEDAGGRSLTILTTKALNEAMNRLISKDDTSTLEDIIKHQCEKTVKKLMEEDFELELLDEKLEELKRKRTQQEHESDIQILDNPSRKRVSSNAVVDDETVEVNSSDEDNYEKSLGANGPNDMNASTRPARGRGSRGPRKPRGATASRTRGRQAKLV